jgi:hypothetical protein
MSYGEGVERFMVWQAGQMARMGAQRTEVMAGIWMADRLGHGIANLIEREAQIAAWDIVFRDVNALRSTGWDSLKAIAEAGPTGDVSKLVEEIGTQKDLIKEYLQLGYRGMLGGGLAAVAESFMYTGQLMYAYKTLAYHTAVTPRMRRRWNELYHPNYPDMETAFRLWRWKMWTRDDAVQAGMYDGWSKDMSSKLVEMMVTVPTDREAFFLYVKKLIDKQQLDAIWHIHGWDPNWNPKLLANQYQKPSYYDLCRTADVTGLPQTWTLKILTENGYNDEDKARLWASLKKRHIRDEERAITAKWLWRYKYGRATALEFEAALNELELPSEEIELLTEKAEMDYADELVDEKITILMWRFRNGVITEDEYLTSLELLGVNHEKANLMVEEQKAMGYFGGYGT